MELGEMDHTGTEAAHSSSPRRQSSRKIAALSICALLMSGVALALSSVALVTARGADTVPGGKATAAPSPAASDPLAPVDEQSPDTAPTVAVTPSAHDGTLVIPADGDYQLAYEKKHLTLNPGETCVTRAIDLDQPLVSTDQTTIDAEYQHCPSEPAPALSFTDPRLASVSNSNPSPSECAQRVGAAPVDTKVTPSQDLTLCAVTNGVGAANQPQRPKIVVLTIDAVANSGTVNLTVSAWTIPY
jgi:hypothetical protein